ncbi:MAG: DUF3696 domain-containing protein [Bacteroidetes bacterium]|nr:DUF3696 domain-containing protein [Bacteroidota bacterium]
MIQKITIENFKCLKNLSFPCRNLNLLTGRNGMGKSSLIQLLLLLRQSHIKGAWDEKEKYISLNGNYINIGAYEDAIYQDFERGKDYIKILIGFSEVETFWKIKSYYETGNESTDIPLVSHNITKKLFSEALFANGKFQFIQAERGGLRDDLPANDRMVKNKDFGKDGNLAMHYFIQNSTKKIPLKNLRHPDTPEEDDLLQTQVNAWLSEISPNIKVEPKYHQSDKTKIIPLFSYLTGDIPKKPFKAKNIGFGVSYVFSVVMSILTAGEDDLIIIENPEAHLHPRGQSKLAELCALAARNGVQIFLETHSDHVLNGIRIAVKEYYKNSEWGIKEDWVNIFYFDRHQEEHFSIVTLINVDKNGKLYKIEKNGKSVNIPKGFFDEWSNALAELI